MSEVLDAIIAQIRGDCRKCYLDNAAMSLQPRQVTEAVMDFHRSRQENGPDFMAWWRKTDELRGMIANRIGGKPEEILFLPSTSMGINLAAGAIPFEPGDNVLITDTEFPSNAYPWFNLEARGVEVRVVASQDRMFPPEAFAALMDARTRAVSVSWVMAATGAVVDIAALSRLCRERRILLVVDAIQGLGALEYRLESMPADILVSGFFKWLQGPDGLAFVYIRRELLPELRVPFAGWAGMRNRFDYSAYRFDLVDEARRFETGNMNFSGIYGAAAALELLEGEQGEVTRRIQSLTGVLRSRIKGIPGVRILSPEEGIVSGITLLAPRDPAKAVQRLRQAGVAVNERAGGIRVSLHYYNFEQDIDLLLEGMA